MNKLTVFFEDPFWVGVFENHEDEELSTCKVVFGAEPKDYEVYEFILNRFFSLKFSRPIKTEKTDGKRISPKRLQRQIRELQQKQGISTKAQEAIRLEREVGKSERKKISKQQREIFEEMKYQKRQEKKREKKKGH